MGRERRVSSRENEIWPLMPEKKIFKSHFYDLAMVWRYYVWNEDTFLETNELQWKRDEHIFPFQLKKKSTSSIKIKLKLKLDIVFTYLNDKY